MVSDSSDGNDSDIEPDIDPDTEPDVELSDGIWEFSDRFGRKEFFWVTEGLIINLKSTCRYTIADLKQIYITFNKVE